jgi:hypothetical protein
MLQCRRPPGLHRPADNRPSVGNTHNRWHEYRPPATVQSAAVPFHADAARAPLPFEGQSTPSRLVSVRDTGAAYRPICSNPRRMGAVKSRQRAKSKNSANPIPMARAIMHADPSKFMNRDYNVECRKHQQPVARGPVPVGQTRAGPGGSGGYRKSRRERLRSAWEVTPARFRRWLLKVEDRSQHGHNARNIARAISSYGAPDAPQ